MILSVNLAEPFPESSEFLAARRPLVLACGCFDLLTVGHVRHLEAAKRYGKTLVVLVTADRYVHKGPNRPVFNEEHRLEMVDALRCVDIAVLNAFPTAVQAIQCFRPDFYVKGRDYSGCPSPKLKMEASAVEPYGRLVFTDAEEMHTSDVIGRLKR